MTTSSPHASSWPPLEEDDGVELLGAASQVVHQVSRAPRPVAPSDHGVDGPSVVISPQAELPTLGERTKNRRVVEPTLVIRDRQQVEELRAGIRRADRRRARRRLGRALFWGTASALAFGFGTAVAFFAASSGENGPGGDGDAAVASPRATTDTAHSVKVAAADGVAAERAAEDAPANDSADGTSARAQSTPDGTSADAEPKKASGPRSTRGSAPVIPLADLPDAAADASSTEAEGAKEPRSGARAPAVVSLEDL